MKVVLKFFRSEDLSKGNEHISATLGKVSIIDKEWLDKHLSMSREFDNDFWLCEILEEICHGQAKGCFVVRPIKRLQREPVKEGREVSPDWPRPLLIRFFTETVINNLLVLTIKPEYREYYWRLPYSLRDYLKKKHQGTYATIIDTEGKGLDFLQLSDMLTKAPKLTDMLESALKTNKDKNISSPNRPCPPVGDH